LGVQAVSDGTTEIQRLLDRLRAGDPAALRDLLVYSRARLRLLVGQMLQGFPRLMERLEASDVLHNVLIRLDAALRAVEVGTALDYLRLCSAHIRWELLDLARHHLPREGRPAILPGPEGDAPDRGTSTDDPARLAVWRELHEAIAALDAEDCQLFDLLYYQGLTQPEAAALLGMPLRTLKTHWRNARLHLMARLGDGPFF
jgi:RNA polymerase sigma-70 factor (ECF subfamily)